jgi:YVTN family beta-propeller protein
VEVAAMTGRCGRRIRAGLPAHVFLFYFENEDTVTPVATATGHAGRAVAVGYAPGGITISRSGATAYVTGTISGTVTPIDTRSGRAAAPVSVGRYRYPVGIALAPSGGTAVVLDGYAGRITLIDTRTDKAAAPIKVGRFPIAVAFAAPFGSSFGLPFGR